MSKYLKTFISIDFRGDRSLSTYSKLKMAKIIASFMERQFFAEDRTETTVKGYELSVIKTGKETSIGRAIDLERLSQAEFTNTKLFQATLPLTDSNIGLAALLELDANGKRWLESFRGYFLDTCQEEVSMTLSIESEKLPTLATYWLYPDIKRVQKRAYKCQQAEIHSLPDTAFYYIVNPPLKFKNGKWIPGLYYNRLVSDAKKTFETYSIHDPQDNRYLNLRGVLLGTLGEDDLKNKEGDFENCFPVEHYLEVSYSVSFRQVHEYNPLTIRVELA